jgi:Tol biopolymer transport system component
MSLRQGRLAAARATWDENMWRVDLPGPGQPAGAPVSLSGSTRSERNAQFSPDGRRIAFESSRSGTHEVWVADADGRNARQLTTFNSALGGTPAWSPDGQSVAFDMRGSDGRGDIFVASGDAGGRTAADRPIRPMTSCRPGRTTGRWIYFESTRTGRAEMWKMPARGGDPVQITHGGATYAKESADGRNLYYSRFQSGLPSQPSISAPSSSMTAPSA